MFGWKLVRESEMAAIATALLQANRLIDHERDRIDLERERADRMADAVFQANGLPATSATVLREQKAAEAAVDEKRTDYAKQLMEIYGETEADMEESGAEPLPEALAEIVK